MKNRISPRDSYKTISNCLWYWTIQKSKSFTVSLWVLSNIMQNVDIAYYYFQVKLTTTDRMPFVTSQPQKSRALLLFILFQYFEQTKRHLRFAMSQIINNKEGALIYVKLYIPNRWNQTCCVHTEFGSNGLELVKLSL